MRMRRIRRIVVPVAATIAVAAVGVAFLLGAAAIIEHWIAATAVFAVPFLLFALVVLVRTVVFRVVVFLVLAVPIAFGVLRGIPGDNIPGDRGSSVPREPALLLVERRGDQLALRLLPVRGVPLVPANGDRGDGGDDTAGTEGSPSLPMPQTADLRVPLDATVTLRAEFLLRPEPLWFLGPPSILMALHIDEGLGLTRRRLLAPVIIDRIETLLVPEVLSVRTTLEVIPATEGTFLQEGVIPIVLNDIPR